MVVLLALWNKFHMEEKCMTLSDGITEACQMVPTHWNIENDGVLYAAIVANLTWPIGTVWRLIQRKLGAHEPTEVESLRARVEELEELAEKLLISQKLGS